MRTRSIPKLSRGTFLRLDVMTRIAVLAMFAVPLPAAQAQPGVGAIPNLQDGNASHPPGNPSNVSRQERASAQAAEKVRAECIQGRRTICGRILKVLPDGLVVESGYTSLMRPPLDKSWLVPGTVPAAREPNLVEGSEPACVCVGLVFLSDIPKSRSLKPKPYDYVVIQAYPAGQYHLHLGRALQRTARRFSALLQTAVSRQQRRRRNQAARDNTAPVAAGRAELRSGCPVSQPRPPRVRRGASEFLARF